MFYFVTFCVLSIRFVWISVSGGLKLRGSKHHPTDRLQTSFTRFDHYYSPCSQAFPGHRQPVLFTEGPAPTQLALVASAPSRPCSAP